MNTKTIAFACAAAVCGAAFAAEDAAEEEKSEGWAYNPGEGVSFDETPIVSAEASLSFDSKYLSYGFVDNKDPILTPAGEITFFDWLTFGVSAIFDVTKYGHRAGYTSRQFQYTELHPTVTLGHSFSPDDFDWLPTTIEFAIGYDYEYHPNSKIKGTYDPEEGTFDKSVAEDTQFWTFEFGLPDLCFEPKFLYERDVMRDNGTYLNLEVGHTFNLLGEEDDTLTLRPSVAQGFGNKQRVSAYATKEIWLYDEDEGPYSEDAPLEHAGLMDTLFKLELGWTICDNVSLSGYVGYSDFLFDRKIRDASRRYEALGKWDYSWNVIAGLAVTLSF